MTKPQKNITETPLQKANLFSNKCPARKVLKHLTSKWGILILVALSKKTLRFVQLQNTISGISQKMLAQTLQALEADGFINRIAYPVIPPHVEYSLTDLGQEAGEKATALSNWIEQNYPKIHDAQQAYKAKNTKP